MVTTNRDVKISAIRMFCTISIITLHITQQLEAEVQHLNIITDWLNLGLVMFCCISAFLYGKKEIKDIPQWYLHRYSEIAIPSVLVGVATILVFYFGDNGITKAQIIGALLSSIGLQVYAPDSWMFIQLWFLSYLLFFYITVPFIQRIECRRVSTAKFWGLFVAIFGAIQVLSAVVERIVGVELLSTGVLLRFYLPYFLYRRYEINGERIKPTINILTVLSVMAIAVVCGVRYVPQIVLSPAIEELMFIYTQTLAGTVLFYWVYRLLGFLEKYIWLLKLSDRYSYEVYLTHCLFIGYKTSIIQSTDNRWLGIIAALLLTAIASIATHHASNSIKTLLKRKSVN